MSHRTEGLPSKHGPGHVFRELRYHEASRQLLAIVLIFVYAVAARPIELLAFAGLLLVLAGTAIRLYASGFIMKNEELATHGPYAMVRHPLYTGNILIILGFALANSTWWALPVAALLFWFYYPAAIEYEDRKLRRLFGASWDQWAAGTPALVPMLGNRRRVGNGRWSLAKSMRQNGELIIAAFIVLCMGLVVWRML